MKIYKNWLIKNHINNTTRFNSFVFETFYIQSYYWISCYWIILFISSLFKVDLHLAYKKPINVNNNTAHKSVNKLPSNNDNNKTKYLIVRQNQHVANRLYITYMTNQASTFLLFVWKILDFWKITICDCFGDKCPYFWSYVRHGLDILQNWDFYFEERFVS